MRVLNRTVTAAEFWLDHLSSTWKTDFRVSLGGSRPARGTACLSLGREGSKQDKRDGAQGGGRVGSLAENGFQRDFTSSMTAPRSHLIF